MALATGQWQIRDLVMGPGTIYTVTNESNPFATTVRDPQSTDRPYSHGSMVGSEWMNQRVVPIRIFTEAASESAGAWVSAHQDLAEAFKPVGSSGEIIELRFELGGSEYLLFGRPRMVEPDTTLVGRGRGFSRCAFVAPDPRIYSAELTSQSTGLPEQQGGLTFPATLPWTIDGVLVSGRLSLTNDGTAASGLKLRIDGPVTNPIVLLRRPDGVVQSIEFDLTLLAGQFLQIDSTNHTAFLNGLPQSNQRGRAVWSMDAFPLQPGSSELRFMSPSFNEAALITAQHRSAWW